MSPRETGELEPSLLGPDSHPTGSGSRSREGSGGNGVSLGTSTTRGSADSPAPDEPVTWAAGVPNRDSRDACELYAPPCSRGRTTALNVPSPLIWVPVSAVPI